MFDFGLWSYIHFSCILDINLLLDYLQIFFSHSVHEKVAFSFCLWLPLLCKKFLMSSNLFNHFLPLQKVFFFNLDSKVSDFFFSFCQLKSVVEPVWWIFNFSCCSFEVCNYYRFLTFFFKDILYLMIIFYFSSLEHGFH